MVKHLGHVSIINRSGFKPLVCPHLKALKKHQYHIVSGYSITGDAPKKFIRVFEYGECRKSHPKTWPLYIAKTGHKWYPTESITEFLLNQLGHSFGLNMAKSRLVMAGNQLRFLSRYFLKPKFQELVHGAEIFVGYMEDESVVHEIEEQQRAREVFTVDFVRKAMEKYFGTEATIIFKDFVKMLIYDAWVGNNDRHFYNWGVVRHIEGKEKPYFSPVYDTARGLFWNTPEKKIVLLHSDPKQLVDFLTKYSKNSRPKTGIDGDPNINHVQLLEYLYNNEIGITKEEFKALVNRTKLDSFLSCIRNDFKLIISDKRRYVIEECLKFRYNIIQSTLNI